MEFSNFKPSYGLAGLYTRPDSPAPTSIQHQFVFLTNRAVAIDFRAALSAGRTLTVLLVYRCL